MPPQNTNNGLLTLAILLVRSKTSQPRERASRETGWPQGEPQENRGLIWERGGRVHEENVRHWGKNQKYVFFRWRYPQTPKSQHFHHALELQIKLRKDQRVNCRRPQDKELILEVRPSLGLQLVQGSPICTCCHSLKRGLRIERVDHKNRRIDRLFKGQNRSSWRSDSGQHLDAPVDQLSWAAVEEQEVQGGEWTEDTRPDHKVEEEGWQQWAGRSLANHHIKVG